MKNKLLTALLGLFIALLIVTFSIGLPIYFRPFYYLQVDLLDIPAYSGAEKEDILTAYNELLDYLTVPGCEFNTGIFKYSESGKDHFVDCKVLFDLNATVLIISAVGVALMLILKRLGVFEPWRPFGMNIAFSSGAYLLGGFALIGGLVAIDFNTAFTTFHKIFFPGKDNWYFSWYEDQIIRILPKDFFMNCAILIFASIVILSAVCIVCGLVPKWRARLAEE